jgi:hypothetical protein
MQGGVITNDEDIIVNNILAKMEEEYDPIIGRLQEDTYKEINKLKDQEKIEKNKKNKKKIEEELNKLYEFKKELQERVKEVEINAKDILEELYNLNPRSQYYQALKKQRFVDQKNKLIHQYSPYGKEGLFKKFDTFNEMSSDTWMIIMNYTYRNFMYRAQQFIYGKNSNIRDANVQIIYLAVKVHDELSNEPDYRKIPINELREMDENENAEHDENENRDLKTFIRYTETQPLPKTVKEIEEMDFNFPTENSGYYVLIIGFKFIFATKKDANFNKTTLKNLKAFSPTNNLKYHKETFVSTTNNKLCLAETYYYITKKIELKNIRNKLKHSDELKKLINNEDDIIKESLKNGELIKSLKLLTKKDNTEINVIFYNSNNPVLNFKNGIMTKIEFNNELNDKLIMLYCKKDQHIAPAKFNKNLIKKFENKKIKKFILRPKKIKSDPKELGGILGYDIETYLYVDGNAIPYCATIYGELNKKEIKIIFYGLDCIKQLVDYIISISTKMNNKKSRQKDKIKQIYIYGYNNNKFDNLFIWDHLFKDEPNLKTIIAGQSIKHIKYNNILIFDMCAFYSGGLSKVALNFGINARKGTFPHNFPKENNLNYIGEIPKLEYWESKEDMDKYIKENGTQFNMEEYTKKYCLLDSEIVYKIAKKHLEFCSGLINNKKYNIRNCFTSAKLSLSLFQQLFLDCNLYQSPDKIYEKELKSYIGGRTEIFKKYFKSSEDNKYINVYDANSQHPNSMTQEMPYQYIKIMKYNNKKIKKEDIIKHNLYNAKSIYNGTNKYYIPNLPTKLPNKEIIALKNTEYDYYWGCELIEAINNDCEIYTNEEIFYSSKPIFKIYIQYLYKKRLEAKKKGNIAEADFYKMCMVSLYGKFGQKTFDNSKIINCPEEMFDLLEGNLSNLKYHEELNNGLFLIKYKNNKPKNNGIGSLVRFSSYISALSRCSLSEIMRDVGHENIYYCDTDCIHTDKKPSDEFIDNCKLGKFKLEKSNIIEAIYIAKKNYMLKTKKDIEKKISGIKNKQVDEKDYGDLKDGVKDFITKSKKLFFKSLNGVIIKNIAHHIEVKYNKRIWNNNDSFAFTNLNEYQDMNKK